MGGPKLPDMKKYMYVYLSLYHLPYGVLLLYARLPR